MAKKRKRKLKKSVKRGCGCIFLLLCIMPAFTIYRCISNRHGEEAEDSIPAIIYQEPDSIDIAMAENLQKTLSAAMHIDTTFLGISVYDLDRNCSVFEYHSRQRLVPASCTKLPTAIMALHYLGTNHKYKSSLFIDGRLQNGTVHGNVRLVMDDDPLIESFKPFADYLKNRGINKIDGEVLLQLARTDTLRQHYTAAPWDIPYSKVPLLMKGGERARRELAQAIRGKGIAIQEGVTLLTEASGEGSQKAAFSVSHSLREVIAPMLIHSSNVKAECIFYHTQHSPRYGDDTIWGDSFFADEMEYADTDGLVLNDGSGLSPQNQLTADFLVQLMAYAYRRDDIRSVLIDEALATPAHPVRRGSLTGRMHKLKGHIFCKTGTLTTIGVSSLTGYAQNESGRWFAFSILGENSPVYDSRIFQDRMCKTLVSMP